MTPQQTTTLRLERTFDCTPQELWAAWTNPKQYAQWMNPAGIELVIHEFDVRVGGKVRFDMPQPDGNANPQEGVFHELVPFKRIVTGDPDKTFLLEVTFEPVGQRTRLVVLATGVPPEFHEAATQGWNVCFDRLGSVVSTRKIDVTEREIVLTRILDAPRAVVFEAFTDPEQLAEWWGPEGFKRNTIHSIDVRAGGTWHYTMHGPDGTDYDNLITYETVDPPRFISYKHGTSEDPDMFRGSATFEEVGGKTRLTFRSVFPTADALKAVERDYGAIQGGIQTLDKLEAHLKNIKG